MHAKKGVTYSQRDLGSEGICEKEPTSRKYEEGKNKMKNEAAVITKPESKRLLALTACLVSTVSRAHSLTQVLTKYNQVLFFFPLFQQTVYQAKVCVLKYR